MAHSLLPWGCRRERGEACRLLFPEMRPEGSPSLAVWRGDATSGSIRVLATLFPWGLLCQPQTHSPGRAQ